MKISFYKQKLPLLSLILLLSLSSIHTNKSKYTCNTPSDCNYRGECLDKNTCKCFDYYTTIHNTSNKQCIHKQLSLKTVFCLSFFFGPMGIDQHFLGNTALGILKILLPLIFILTSATLCELGKKKKYKKSSMLLIGRLFEILSSILILVWWIIDCVLILEGYYSDEKNIRLFNDLYSDV